MLTITCIDKGFRMTVYRAVRKILGLYGIDEIEWILEDNKTIVRKRGGNDG